MCGRFAQGIAIEELPQKFNETVLKQGQPAEALGRADDGHYESWTEVAGKRHPVQITVTLSNYDASYNIPPTSTGVIIYMDKTEGRSVYSYKVEASKFGLLPVWCKPRDSSPVKKGNRNGAAYSREVQSQQAKLFNCRKETLAQEKTVWAGPRNSSRCVVPIQGYFEWLSSKSGKVPYYVYSEKSPVLYLAGLYAHNFNYNDTGLVPEGNPYFSSFSIVTGPAAGKSKNDMSWLHSRKPIFIEPNSKAWLEWLDPDVRWSGDLLRDCLDTTSNPVYELLSWHKVSKAVGNPSNKSRDVIQEEKSKQSSISAFLSPVKTSENAGSRNGADVEGSRTNEKAEEQLPKKQEKNIKEKNIQEKHVQEKNAQEKNANARGPSEEDQGECHTRKKVKTE